MLACRDPVEGRARQYSVARLETGDPRTHELEELCGGGVVAGRSGSEGEHRLTLKWQYATFPANEFRRISAPQLGSIRGEAGRGIEAGIVERVASVLTLTWALWSWRTAVLRPRIQPGHGPLARLSLDVAQPPFDTRAGRPSRLFPGTQPPTSATTRLKDSQTPDRRIVIHSGTLGTMPVDPVRFNLIVGVWRGPERAAGGAPRPSQARSRAP